MLGRPRRSCLLHRPLWEQGSQLHPKASSLAASEQQTLPPLPTLGSQISTAATLTPQQPTLPSPVGIPESTERPFADECPFADVEMRETVAWEPPQEIPLSPELPDFGSDFDEPMTQSLVPDVEMAEEDLAQPAPSTPKVATANTAAAIAAEVADEKSSGEWTEVPPSEE